MAKGSRGCDVFLRQERLPSMRHDVHLTDIWRGDADGGEPAAELSERVHFGGGGCGVQWRAADPPPLPPPLLLGSRSSRCTSRNTGWCGSLDVARALTERGYLPGVHGEVHLDVGDELFPENAGRYVLIVADGRGMVQRGGNGSVRLNVRSLAALYTGFATAHGLKVLGRIEGDEASLRGASAVFAGGGCRRCRICSEAGVGWERGIQAKGIKASRRRGVGGLLLPYGGDG